MLNKLARASRSKIEQQENRGYALDMRVAVEHGGIVSNQTVNFLRRDRFNWCRISATRTYRYVGMHWHCYLKGGAPHKVGKAHEGQLIGSFFGELLIYSNC
jgi:hypothetical protein